jgi:urease accessory protein
MRLRAERVGARSVLTRVERTAPFHPGPAHYQGLDGRTPEIIVQGVGPGIFPGDRLLAEVAVGPGAVLVVRGQGAAKAYPSPTGVEAWSETRLDVADGGALWWLPGELIPFRRATLRQETTVRLATGSRLALLDLLVPGRLAAGERDAYARLDLRLRVEREGRPLLIERALLDPCVRPLAGPGGFGGFGCAGTLVLVGYGAPSLASPSDTAGVWLGADGRDGWALVRALGPSADATRRALLAVLAAGAATP